MAARKKPTKAEMKQKKAKRSGTNMPAKPAATSTKAYEKCVADANGKRMVLHIGCSVYKPEKLHASFRNDDWHEVRLDIDESVKPDIVSDMTAMPMIPDNGVDAIWSSHNVEHLYPHIVPVAMNEFYRILKPGGHFLVTLPDLESVCNYVARGMLEDPIYESPAGPICAIDILYGFRKSMANGNLFMAHKTGFTAKTLGQHLQDAGFTNIHVTRKGYDLWAQGFKYPVGHPQRLENITVRNLNNEEQPSLPKPLPMERFRHPGYINDRRPTDDLGIPPKKEVPSLS